MKIKNQALTVGLLSVLLLCKTAAAQSVIDGENADVKIVSASIDIRNPIPNTEYCHYIDIHAVLKKAAFSAATFAGVGFYSNFKIEWDASPLFSKADVSKYLEKPVRLKTGEDAMLLKFRGVGYCWLGSMSSSQYQTLSFKPYALYYAKDEHGVTNTYKQWAEGDNSWLGGKFDYATYRTLSRTSFDDSASLLK